MNQRLFFLLDFAAFFVILFITVALRRWEISWPVYFSNCKLFLFVFAFTTFVLWLFSFYDIKALRKQNIRYKTLAVALVISTFLSASFFYFLSGRLPLLTPKAILLGVLVLYFIYVCWVRKAYFRWDFVKTSLLSFGNSDTLSEILRETASSKGFRVRNGGGYPNPRTAYSLRNLDLVVIASGLFRQHPEAWPTVVEKFIAKGACVDTDFNVFEHIFRRVSRESINDGMWLLRGIGNRRESAMYNMLKRSMDMTLAVCMLPFLLPLGGVIWLTIKLIDRENPLFEQKRVGYMGKSITIYKFRTIKQKNQESENEEITRTGAILRRFRLDEIPQLLNVLKGDISFVGPRPLWAGEWDILNQHIPNHSIRTIVKPGITGWAQLNFKAPPNYKITFETPDTHSSQIFDDAFTRFSYDVWYIKNRSVLLDIEILVKTGIRMFIKDSHVA